MHFKPSVIVFFAAMLTVTIAAPTPASEMKEKRVAAPGVPAEDTVYLDTAYPEKGKRSDEDEDDPIYYKINYPESESEKRATTQEFEGRK